MVCTLKASREELCHIQNSVASIHKDFLFFSDNLKCNKRNVIVFLLQFVNSYPLRVMAANCINPLSTRPHFKLERFLQGVRDVRQASGPLFDLSPSSFTVVSIDNIDVMAPYAAVAADKPRSWHGTSVMAQQPQP